MNYILIISYNKLKKKGDKQRSPHEIQPNK